MEQETRPAQLELFDLPAQAPRRRGSWVPRTLTLRHDHAVLLLILGLIGGSVVFVCGVERGKQLARFERMLLEPASGRVADVKPAEPAADAKAINAPATTKTAPAPKAAPGAPAKMPVKSRYAVRVVTYSQPGLAQLELKQLQRRGETAFLMKQSDRTALYVGPFPSREHAAEKLAVLRRQYRDCFIQSL